MFRPAEKVLEALMAHYCIIHCSYAVTVKLQQCQESRCFKSITPPSKHPSCAPLVNYVQICGGGQDPTQVSSLTCTIPEMCFWATSESRLHSWPNVWLIVEPRRSTVKSFGFVFPYSEFLVSPVASVSSSWPKVVCFLTGNLLFVSDSGKRKREIWDKGSASHRILFQTWEIKTDYTI